MKMERQMRKINQMHFLLFICAAFVPRLSTTLLSLDWLHISMSNYALIHDCGFIRYRIEGSESSYECIPASLVDQFLGKGMPYILQHINVALNSSETVVNRLEIELINDEFKKTVVLDGNSLLPSFNFSYAVVTNYLYQGKPDPSLCPRIGPNGETSGVISFINWTKKTYVKLQTFRGCRNENESIITIQNSDDITLEDMLFEDNVQSPILIIDSNVSIINCTIKNTQQYYTKEHIKEGLPRDVMTGFSLGITIIMTKNSTNNRVEIHDTSFENNHCMKFNRSYEQCMHKVTKNAIPASYYGGAIGISIGSSTGSILICNTQFINNTACDSGGGVFIHVFEQMTEGRFEISDSTFRYNTAGYLGGGLYVMQQVEAHNFQLSLYNDTFESNQGCIAGGGITLLVADTSHEFNLIKNYTNINKEPISFVIAVSTKFFWNYSGRLSSGHAAYLKAYANPAKRQHPVMILIHCEFNANFKINSNPNGFTFGSITAQNFILAFWGNNSIVNSTSGGMLLIQSIVIVNGSLTFQNLSAYTGGAIHARRWSKLLLTDDSDVLFKNNKASIAGGAIFHYYGNWNGYSGSSVYNAYCLLGYFPNIREEPSLWKARVWFEGNDAGTAGGAVFLTDLSQCALVDGRIQLRLAFNFTDKFEYVKNTVAQGRYAYLSNSDTYGAIASPVVKLKQLSASDSIERGPGIERPLNLEPMDQLNQTTIAVVSITPETEEVELENQHRAITQEDINEYYKCKHTDGINCLEGMPYIIYTVSNDFNETSITFNYTIQSGVESINIDDDYFNNDQFTILDTYCDVGYTLKDRKCVCNVDGTNGIVRCSSTGEVYIKPGYWAIKKQKAKNTEFKLSNAIAKCGHSTCTCTNKQYALNCPITENPNDLCIKEIHVEGDLCGSCQKNYTAIPFSIVCVNAPYRNMHELMATYVGLTFVCACLIILFRCKLWNGFRMLFLILYALTYINYSFNFNQHVHTLRAIQVLQGLSILNFYTIYPAYRDLTFNQVELLSLYPVFTILFVLIIFAILSAISYRFPASIFHLRFKMRRLVSPCILLWFMMTISLFRVFLDFVYCIHVTNNSTEKPRTEFRNRYDGSIDCYTLQNEYLLYMLGIVIATLILVFSMPLLLIIGALKRNTTKSYALNKLIIPFKPIGRFHWAWEYIRFLILATGLSVHDFVPKIGNSILMISIVFLMITHITFWPYKEWSSNIIECIGWILLSLVYIINHKVEMNRVLDTFQLILIISIFILVWCTFIVYICWKAFSKLKKDKFQTKLKKFLSKYNHISIVRTCSGILYRKLNEDEAETTDEVRDLEKPKPKSSESLHRRDSILANLSIKSS